jgi:hypothetical protein
MKLVPDAAPAPQGQRVKTFKFEGCLVLVGMKIAPGGVKLARHANHWLAEGAGIAGGDGEMVVAPVSGGKRFNFKVRVSRFLATYHFERTLKMNEG